MIAATKIAPLGRIQSQRTPVAEVLERDLNRFLASVERRALTMAEIGVRDRDEALDIVQDAMIRLVRSYSDRPPEDWAPLFFRILTNRIRDTHRRNKVRNRVMSWFSQGESEDYDPIAAAPDLDGATPGEELEAEEAHAALLAGVAALPARQREAFMLRSLEGLNVAATAKAMGCSVGSVKTHYSRALSALRACVEE